MSEMIKTAQLSTPMRYDMVCATLYVSRFPPPTVLHCVTSFFRSSFARSCQCSTAPRRRTVPCQDSLLRRTWQLHTHTRTRSDHGFSRGLDCNAYRPHIILTRQFSTLAWRNGLRHISFVPKVGSHRSYLEYFRGVRSQGVRGGAK